jgi:hypothetical protein
MVSARPKDADQNLSAFCCQELPTGRLGPATVGFYAFSRGIGERKFRSQPLSEVRTQTCPLFGGDRVWQANGRNSPSWQGAKCYLCWLSYRVVSCHWLSCGQEEALGRQPAKQAAKARNLHRMKHAYRFHPRVGFRSAVAVTNGSAVKNRPLVLE